MVEFIIIPSFIVFSFLFFWLCGSLSLSKNFPNSFDRPLEKKRKLFIAYLDCQTAHDLYYDLLNNTANLASIIDEYACFSIHW